MDMGKKSSTLYSYKLRRIPNGFSRAIANNYKNIILNDGINVNRSSDIYFFFFFILTCLDWKEFINQFKGNVILRTSDITPDQFYEWNKKQDLNLKDFNLSLTISTPNPRMWVNSLLLSTLFSFLAPCKS